MIEHGIDKIVTIQPVDNYVVVTASNKHVPIIGRFYNNITINGKDYNSQAVIYIFDGKRGCDINSDVVLGRQVMATADVQADRYLYGKTPFI